MSTDYLPRFFERLRNGKPVTIVAYGDSISEVGRTPNWYGGASSADRNWAQLVGSILRARNLRSEVSVLHFGIGGQNTYEALGRLDWLPPMGPDLVLIELGANDCEWHEIPPRCTEVAMRQLLAGIAATTGCEIVVVGLAGGNPLGSGFAHQEETRSAIERAAQECGAPHVDLRPAVLEATCGGKQWLEFHCGESDCHPNDRGHRLWADTVANKLVSFEGRTGLAQPQDNLRQG